MPTMPMQCFIGLTMGLYSAVVIPSVWISVSVAATTAALMAVYTAWCAEPAWLIKPPIGHVAGRGWLCVLRGLLCVCGCGCCAAGDVRCLGYVRYCDFAFSFNSVRLVVWLQAPGFGDGEAFTSETFTGKSSTGFRDPNIELEEMEVFAVSGYP